MKHASGVVRSRPAGTDDRLTQGRSCHLERSAFRESGQHVAPRACGVRCTVAFAWLGRTPPGWPRAIAFRPSANSTESVDSAPWFWLRRSCERPSQQAPVPRIPQREAEVVAAQKPLERQPRLVQPFDFVGRLVSGNAGRDGRTCFDRLLIEGRGRSRRGGKNRGSRRAGSSPSASAARCTASGATCSPISDASLLVGPLPAQDQRMRQPGIRVRDDVLEPGPIVGRVRGTGRSAGQSKCPAPDLPTDRRSSGAEYS